MEFAYAIYVTRQGAEDAETALETMRTLGRELRPRYDDGRLAGFNVVAVTDEEDYVEYEIDREWLDDEQVGSPPFLYVQVSWEQDRPGPDVDELVERYQLRLLVSVPNPR
jgi:hypothetical protein